MRLLCLYFIALATVPLILSAEVRVSARFNPPRIALGNPSQYVVELTETSTRGQAQAERITSLPLPDNHGLNLRNGRTSSSQQTRIINGAAEYSITQSLIIDAIPPQVGRFTIDSYSIEYKGQRLSVPAATLEVLERSADAGPSRDELIFLQTELPDQLYLGQQIPIELKLYLEESVQLSGLNAFDRSADGFTLSQLPDDYSEGVEMANGRRYRTLTWQLTLTPIQTGTQELSFQFGLTARLPGQRNERDPFGRSPFGGSLFDDFFGRAERLNVFTDNFPIEVLPLPQEGQPESFSGAVGDFAMEVAVDAEQAVQGEPIMLSVVVRGSGNFERINGPSFSDIGDWKHYPPERKFEASDKVGLRGSLRFDYVFVPEKAGELELPPTLFSYFDPEKKEFIELSSPAIPVKILPAQHSVAPPPPIPRTEKAESEAELSTPLSAEEVMLLLDYQPKRARHPGYGIVKDPVFLSLHLLTGLAVIAAVLVQRRRRRQREDPTFPVRSAASASLRKARAEYSLALQQSDAEAFYKSGLVALRSAASLRTGRLMHSADSADIEALLPEQTASDCRAFFSAANAYRFGGGEQVDLKAALDALERILKVL